jgi:hypothetical protein
MSRRGRRATATSFDAESAVSTVGALAARQAACQERKELENSGVV